MGGSWEGGNPSQLIVVAYKERSPVPHVCYVEWTLK